MARVATATAMVHLPYSIGNACLRAFPGSDALNLWGCCARGTVEADQVLFGNTEGNRVVKQSHET